MMYRSLTALAFLACASPAVAQSVVCDPTCRDPRTSSAASSQSSSNSAARSSSRSNATGAIAGTQVNAPISSSSTSRGGSASSRAQGGSSNVVVVNRVSSGGGSRGYAGAGTTASDPPAATDPPGPVLGSPGDPLTENIGGTTTVRNTPEIVPAPVSGSNPCLVGIAAGGAGPGVGVTFSWGHEDSGCERRNQALILHNIGAPAAAIELMCDDSAVREAMARAGQPCEQDRAKAAAVAPRVQVAGPPGQVDPAIIRREQTQGVVPVTPTAVYATAAALPPKRPVRPDWCGTASAAELRNHPQCDIH